MVGTFYRHLDVRLELQQWTGFSLRFPLYVFPSGSDYDFDGVAPLLVG